MHLKADARRTLLICVLLAGVTLIAYLPLFQNDFVKYDDREYLLDNLHVSSGLSWPAIKWAFQTGYSSNWHPLTWISHMLDVQLFGLKPLGHHSVSLLFHIANALLLFLLFRFMTGAVWRSALVGALFAVHPLHVESVAWVAERKDVLSTFFGFLSLIAYAKYATQKEARRTKNEEGSAASSNLPYSIFYLLSVFLFALGLMSKPMLVTWPFVMLLLDFWPLGRLRVGELRVESDRSYVSISRLMTEKLPFFALSLASCVVTFIAQRHGHSVIPTEALTAELRIENAVVSYLRYLGKAVWPVNLAVFYPHPGIQGPAGELPEFYVFAAAAVLVAVSVVAVTDHKRRPWLATGWFWYLGTLVPVIGIVQVGGQAIADRYTYVPLIGFFVCVVWASADLFDVRRTGNVARAALGGLATVACMALTHQQIKFWRTDRSLFEHALAITGNNPVAHYNLGVDLGEAGDYKSATEHFQAVLAYDPNFAEAYYSLGYIASLEGRDNDAIELYRTTLRLKPWHTLAHRSLGAILWKQGNRSEAIQECEQAVQSSPDQFAAHYNLGVAYYGEGRIVEGDKQFAEALLLNPNYTQARARLAESPAKLLSAGLAFVSQRKPKDAAAVFEKAVQSNPDWPEALNNLAWLRATCWAPEVRDGSEAVRLAERACQIAGDKVPGFLGTLAAAYAEAGRFDDAIKTAERAKDLATANRQKEIAERNQQLLALYRAGKPYHEPASESR